MTADRLPWGKFVWAHWEGDEALALCSMAAQGLWMRLLCIAAKEGGYVLIGGKAPTAEKLGRVVRASAQDVEAWLSELEEEGVFSRTGEGVIYSRRMVREAKAAKRNRENGAKGGNPNLRKDGENGARDNPPSQPPGQPPGGEGVKAEKEKEEEEKENPPTPKGAVRPEDVDAVWRLGSKISRDRSSKAELKKALEARLKAGMTLATVIEGVGAYLGSEDQQREDGQYQQAIHRVVKGARWEAFVQSEPPAPLFDNAAPVDDIGSLEQPGPRRQRSWMEDWRESPGLWREHERGPTPGQPGCRVSDAIQREYGVEPATDEAQRGAA